MMIRSFVRASLSLLVAPLLAACGDDDGTGVDRLTPEEVTGSYAVCLLSFDPTQQVLPTVDIRTEAFDLSPNALPTLALGTNRQFELEYTPRGQPAGLDVELSGTYEIEGSAGVELRFTGSSGVTPTSLLLPQELDLTFQPTARTLTVGPSVEYNVPRADYARMAKISESGLANQIPGRMTAQFRVGGCG